MASSSNLTLVIVAVIGVVGTLGTAVIANWDKISPGSSPGNDANMVAPHAPSIEINQRYTMWGENTMQFELAPGETKILKGAEIYAHVATYPSSSCAGPGFVPYTWQVRLPYPGGGDLEIRQVLMGGMTEQIGLGSLGRGTLGYCGEHTFKNNGVEPIQVEVRYASAADPDQ